MKRITEYSTAQDSNIKDLDRIVNEMIEQGFQPFASPYVIVGGEFPACQTMVKYKEESKP